MVINISFTARSSSLIIILFHESRPILIVNITNFPIQFYHNYELGLAITQPIGAFLAR